jgi:endonuclease/exonuclease/phosphatase family metal-dependent hydrolase
MLTRLPGRLLTLLLPAALAGLLGLAAGCGPLATESGGAGAGDYLFCFWNTENLFDDIPGNSKGRADRDFDRWFATDAAARKQKYGNLANVLLQLNGGKGPDILAVAEVESARAADLLRQTLNGRLSDLRLHYKEPLVKIGGGRHIGVAVLTRLKVGRIVNLREWSRLRITEVHLEAGGCELVVIASHWTSRVSDHTGAGRGKYGNLLYGRFRTLYERNAAVDLLICGDFNDNPDDDSVTKHLRATGDLAEVRGGGKPLLFNLFARAWKEGEASHAYGRAGFLFDQIVVSPGLLDRSCWSVDVDSARIVKQMAFKGRPNSFGRPPPKDRRPLRVRGASDHFPVTVRLSVNR